MERDSDTLHNMPLHINTEPHDDITVKLEPEDVTEFSFAETSCDVDAMEVKVESDVDPLHVPLQIKKEPHDGMLEHEYMTSNDVEKAWSTDTSDVAEHDNQSEAQHVLPGVIKYEEIDIVEESLPEPPIDDIAANKKMTSGKPAKRIHQHGKKQSKAQPVIQSIIKHGDMANTDEISRKNSKMHKKISTKDKNERKPAKKRRKGVGKFRCDECGFRVMSRSSLNHHKLLLHGIGDRKLQRCSKCDMKFINPSGLNRHMTNKHSDKNVSCAHCEFHTDKKILLHYHMAKVHLLISTSHTGPRRRSHPKPQVTGNRHCSVCLRKFFSIEDLQIHKQRTCSPTKKHFRNLFKVCYICGKEFEQKLKLENHIQTYHKGQLHKCSLCPRQFYESKNLKNHILIKHENIEKKFKCESCGKMFYRYKECQHHKKYVHETETLSCFYCPVKTKYKYYLARHIQDKHFPAVISDNSEQVQHPSCSSQRFKPLKQNFPCNFCDLVFRTKSAKKSHLRKEHSTLRFTCPECGRKYLSEDALNRHKCKLYECKECDIKFRCQSILKNHMVKSICHNKKFNECKVCGKIIMSEALLLRHMQSHDNKFECDICLKMFNHKGDLNQHKITHDKFILGL